MGHHTIQGLCSGSAGPEMKDRVQPILEKNSSLMGTSRWIVPGFLLAFLGWGAVLVLFSIAASLISDSVSSGQLISLEVPASTDLTGALVAEVGFLETSAVDFWIDSVIKAISAALSDSSKVVVMSSPVEAPEDPGIGGPEYRSLYVPPSLVSLSMRGWGVWARCRDRKWSVRDCAVVGAPLTAPKTMFSTVVKD